MTNEGPGNMPGYLQHKDQTDYPDGESVFDEAPERLFNYDDTTNNQIDQLPKPKTRRIHLDHSKSSKLESDDAIAIVGIGGKFPGADNVDEFWRVLVNGENHVIEIPPERWNVEEYYSADYDEPGKTYVRRAGFLSNFDEFDCKMFGISEPEAAKMDPQQRYVLECVHMALEDGGIPRKDINGSRTAVYIGFMNDDYKSASTEDPAVASNYTLTGTAPSIIAARVSYVYNLLGPSMSIDTACSSSMVAIHLASQALKSGDCKMAICGGVNSILYPDIFIPLAKARMVSPTGQCQTFSDTADGYIRGEGAGVVILKRLKEAIEDDNKIWATIVTGCNQDGRTMTPITAPSVQMQTELLQEVYEHNNIDPNCVQYIEAHGTGTPVGDPIEANSLGEFFKQYMVDNGIGNVPLRIGSVKTNIGHLESAAGVAGIIKVLLMMKHAKTVKSLHFKRPNPKINFPKYNMEVCVKVDDWPVLEGGSRVACVNSFGFGGTNSHVVIKQFPTKGVQEIKKATGQKYIVFLSAMDNNGLSNSLRYFSECLRETSVDKLRSIAYTSSIRRDHFKYRIAFVAESKVELQKKVDNKMKTLSSLKPPGLNPPNIVFVYCGVGTAWTGMGQELLETEIEFRAAVLRIDKLLKTYTSISIFKQLQEGDVLCNPLVSHLAIFTCQIGLTEVWKCYGITPKVVLGQSVGEVAAAYVSGALSLEDAVKVIYHRSEILSKVKGGSMFVVGNSETKLVESLCEQYDNKTNIAVYNSSVSCTVSGDTDVCNELMKTLKNNSNESNTDILLRDLDVRCAYHSSHTEAASRQLEIGLSDLSGNSPDVKIISTITGEEATGNQFITGSYWRENVRKPVRFQEAVGKSYLPSTFNIFVEIGPKPVLKAHLKDIIDETKAVSLPSMTVKSERESLMKSLADLYSYGIDLNMSKINPYTPIRSDIPKYIPNRVKSLFEADSTKLRKQGMNQLNSTHQFLKRQSDDSIPFRIDINMSSTPYVYEHNVAGSILIPGAFYAEVGLETSKSFLDVSPFNVELSLEFYRPIRLTTGSTCEAFVHILSLDSVKNVSFNIQHEDDIIARGYAVKLSEQQGLNLADVQRIKERCSIYHTKEMTYETLEALGFTYGDDLKILGNGYKNKHECLVEMHLSETLMGDLSTTNLHPAVLDGLLQTPGIIHDIMDEKPSGRLLPAKIGKLILRRPPVRHMLAYLVRKSSSEDEIVYNLLLLQMGGIVVAEVKDFVLKSTKTSDKSSGKLAYKIMWTEFDSTRTTSNNLESPHSEESRSLVNTNTNDDFICKADVESNIDEFDKSATISTGKTDLCKDDNLARNAGRKIIVVSIDKDRDGSFKEYVNSDIEVICYVWQKTTNITKDILEKHFGRDTDFENKAYCLLFVAGTMRDHSTNGESLLNDAVNNCDTLLAVLKYMANKEVEIPIYVITHSTQPIDVCGQMNLVGSELWGLVRSVLWEQNFKLYLIDIDPDLKSCMNELMYIINDSQHDFPEVAIRKGKIYQNEFVLQPDSEQNCIQTIKVVDDYSIVEYRSQLPDTLHDTFYSLQEIDNGGYSNFMKIKPIEACLHDKTMYPLTFETAIESVNMWPHDFKDGYGVLTFEIIGKKLDKVHKKTKNNDSFVACYPLKVQSVINVPKSCVANLKELPPYVPGMLRNSCLLWQLVDKLPTKKSYSILTDEKHKSIATILKEMILTRNSGSVVVFETHEIESPDQITPVFIPLLKVDLKTIHGILNNATSMKVIASFRHFLPLRVERYISARAPEVAVVAIDFDEVLSKSRLQRVVPSVINWMKKQKQKLVLKELPNVVSTTSDAFSLPERCLDLSVFSNIENCQIRVPDNLIFRKTAVYIIIGGMTGLGWEITKHLAKKGAGYIVSFSRRDPSFEKKNEIKELSESFECFITTSQTDITDIVSLKNAFADIESKTSYPIKGVFQGAGVLDDALFLSMTKEKIRTVLMPKVLGTWNLHIASRNLSLDYFVMHSSMTSIIGNAGQTNYGAANAFLDSFAHFRRNLGLSGQSINWGPLKVGMAVNDNGLVQILDRRGLFSLSISTVKKCFLDILKNDAPQVTYGKFDWDIIASGLESQGMDLIKYRFRSFIEKALEQNQTRTNAVKMNFNLNDCMALSEEDQLKTILNAVYVLASEVFGVERSLLNEETLVSALGVDSMSAMTFVQTVKKVLYVQCSMVMLLRDGTTLKSVAEYIHKTLGHSDGEQQDNRTEMDPSVYSSMTPYEKRAYNGYLRDKYDPSLYMFGDVTVDSAIAKPKYWRSLIEKIHIKYPVLRTVFVPGHADIRYGVKREVLNADTIKIDFRIVDKSLLEHKTRHPPNVDDYLFDPAHDLPMRTFYAKNGAGAIMRFLFNHLSFDLFSISMIMNDLKPNAPVGDNVEPMDIAVPIERKLLDDREYLEQFWNSAVPENLAPMSLTLSGDLTTDPNFFGFHRVEVPHKLNDGLKPILERHKCSLFHFFTTMFQILLHVELKQSTISIMTTIDCRMFFPDLQKEANRFTNRIPLFVQLNDGTLQVVDILERNKKNIMQCLDHGYMPFIDIISKVKNPVNEIFRHQIVMEETDKMSALAVYNGKKAPLRMNKLQVGNYYNETIFYIWNDPLTDKLEIELGHSTLIIDDERAGSLLGFMLMMIGRLVADPGIILQEMTSYNMCTPTVETSLTTPAIKNNDRTGNVFIKQTTHGWDHEVYLEIDKVKEVCLRWGSKPGKLTRKLSCTDICDIQMIDMKNHTALILTTLTRNYVFKTDSNDHAMQWMMTLRDLSKQASVNS